MYRYRKLGPILAVLLLVAFLPLIALGCGSKPSAEPPKTGQQQPTTPPAPTVSEFSQIAAAADKYLSAKKPPTMEAKDVYNNIVMGKDPGYVLLSIRKPEDYAKGHVPGAINIPYGEIWKKENLAKLPKDKKIIVICYTGHTASQVTMLLNLLGYDAYAMKFGMMGWTADKDVLGIPVFEKAYGYPTDTAAVAAGGPYDLPTISTGKSSLEDIILARAEAYLTAKKPPTIDAKDVYNNVVMGGDQSYFLLSVRKPDHDNLGHVKGALTIPFAEIAKEENLKKLPKDKKIVVICYTGHTASQTTMLLNLLGYDAYAMKFGMMGWTSNKDVLGIQAFEKAAGYPTTAGTNP